MSDSSSSESKLCRVCSRLYRNKLPLDSLPCYTPPKKGCGEEIFVRLSYEPKGEPFTQFKTKCGDEVPCSKLIGVEGELPISEFPDKFHILVTKKGHITKEEHIKVEKDFIKSIFEGKRVLNITCNNYCHKQIRDI